MSVPPEAARVRVMLVDDHAIVRSGLAAFLESEGDIAVVASLDGGTEAVSAYAGAAPDVVLMDLSMPIMDGVEATSRIRAAHPAARVVVLTTFSDRTRISAALDAGACGYLLKDASPGDLAAAVRAAAAGGAPMDPRVAAVVLEERTSRRAPTEGSLSARELDVLRLVRDGRSNREIARSLGIAEKTVKAHLTRIFERLGVQDRTQAALWAERSGLFPEVPGGS